MWTGSNKEFLVKYYSVLGPKSCAEILKTSDSSVRAAASRLGLNKSITKSHEKFCSDLNDKGIFLIALDKYTDGDTPIKFKCYHGHEFVQRPRTVLERYGKCPQCSNSGFKDHLPAELYLIEFPFDEAVYKLGITNNSAEYRHQQDINKYKATVCWKLKFDKGKDARRLETELKHKYADFQYNTGLLKSGNTETFSCYINKPEIKC